MAGFGAYPKSADNAAGCGPKREYLSLARYINVLLLIILKHPSPYSNSNKHEYDFETIHNIDAYTTDTCWTFREAMKSWNMCVQYWLAINVYKRFPSKSFRLVI